MWNAGGFFRLVGINPRTAQAGRGFLEVMDVGCSKTMRDPAFDCGMAFSIDLTKKDEYVYIHIHIYIYICTYIYILM